MCVSWCNKIYPCETKIIGNIIWNLNVLNWSEETHLWTCMSNYSSAVGYGSMVERLMYMQNYLIECIYSLWRAIMFPYFLLSINHYNFNKWPSVQRQNTFIAIPNRTNRYIAGFKNYILVHHVHFPEVRSSTSWTTHILYVHRRPPFCTIYWT